MTAYWNKEELAWYDAQLEAHDERLQELRELAERRAAERAQEQAWYEELHSDWEALDPKERGEEPQPPPKPDLPELPELSAPEPPQPYESRLVEKPETIVTSFGEALVLPGHHVLGRGEERFALDEDHLGRAYTEEGPK